MCQETFPLTAYCTMWTSESNKGTSGKHGKMPHSKSVDKTLKDNVPNSLALLIEDLHFDDNNMSRSEATTQERSIVPEEQFGLSTVDTFNEWDHSIAQINHHSPHHRSFHSSIDREFDYHGQPKWASLEVSGPTSMPNLRGEAFPLQGSFASCFYNQEASPFSGFGNMGTLRTDTLDSYSTGTTGYRPSDSFPNSNFMKSNYMSAHGQQLTGARPSNSISAPIKAPRNMEPVDGYVYQVQFKRAHKNYILAPSAPRNIIPGDFVKVEADRGEDMGIVLSKSPASDFEEVIPTAGYRGRGFSSGQGERKFLFRLASSEERMALVDKVRDEEQALATIREKAAERCLPMVILDAEYQFDRHKLTFFFEADRRIDFRELVSELFSQYKTRIWMQQVDTSTLASNDAGTELARATGFLPKRDDRAYMEMAHNLMRGGPAPSPQVSPVGRGSNHQSHPGPLYGNEEPRGGLTFNDNYSPGAMGIGSSFGGLTGGRGGGPQDRRAPGTPDPWMFGSQR